MDTLTRGHPDRRDTVQQASVISDNAAVLPRTVGFGLSQAFSVLAAGIICGLLAVMFSISAAALLFSGELSEHITVAIAICLFGTIVLSSVIAVSSSCPGMVSVSQEVTVVTLSLIALSIHAAMAGVRSDAEIIATVIVMIGLATSVTGLCLLAMGFFRLGRLIRFIPYPVIGGFLAGMGWLIVVGAMNVILGDTLSLQNATVLFDGSNVAKWLPAMVFACTVGALARRTGSSFILPVAVMIALVMFHAAAWVLDVPLAQLQSEGWLFQPLSQGGIWPPVGGNPFAGVDWTVIWAEAPKVIALVAITATSVLFASSGIELSVRRDVDLDRELRAAGVANLLAGAGGGTAGFQGLGLSILGHQLGAPYRAVGVIVAAVCAFMLFFGSSLLAYMPIPLFGGLLLWIGVSLLYDWLVDAHARIPRREYLIILLIVFVIATVGLLEGVLAGLFSAVVLFALEYSRVEIVKYAVTGKDFHSSFEHADEDRQFLTSNGRQVLILRLQGFVFFGTVHKLQKLVAARLQDEAEPALRFLVLDCRDVTGLDSSAALGFMKISQLVERSDGTLITANLCETVAHQLIAAADRSDSGLPIRQFDDLDRALEWCEEHLLQHWVDRPLPDRKASIADQLARILNDAQAARVMLPYLEKMSFEPQASLIRQDEKSKDIFFIELGKVSVQLETPEGAIVRLRTLGTGTMVGEISFCLDQRRSASVIAECDTTAWRLSNEALEKMTLDAPVIASQFSNYLVRVLAERLTSTNRLIRLLTD